MTRRVEYLFVILIVVIVLENAQATSHLLDVGYELLLDQIEAHGQQSNAEKQIQGTVCNGLLRFILDSLGGNKVSKTCRENVYQTQKII